MNDRDRSQDKVLVLSADKAAISITLKSLKKLGYAAITFMDNGLDALKSIEKSSFDFVLCDVNIRFVNGYLFIKEVKNSENIPNIPVILFGSSEPPDTEENLKKYGIIQYLQVPFTESQMDFAIHSTISLFNTSGTIENKFTKAKDSLLKNESEKAVELYSELSALTSGSTRSNIGLAQSYMKTNNKEKAEEILTKVAESEEDSPTRYLMQARMSLQKKKVVEANQTIGKLLEGLPNEFYFSRVIRLYMEFKAFKEAEEVCEEALGHKFELVEVYNSYAKCKYLNSQFEKALEIVVQTEKKFGIDTSLLNLRGVCYKKLGKITEALASYEEALRLSPNDAKVYFNLAQCAIGLKNYQGAEKYLDACLKISPNFPRAGDQLNEIRSRNCA